MCKIALQVISNDILKGSQVEMKLSKSQMQIKENQAGIYLRTIELC